MITPAYALTATERVLPRLALDFTTAVADPRVATARSANTATRFNSSGVIEIINADLPRFDFAPSTLLCSGQLIEEARTNLFLNSLIDGTDLATQSVTLSAVAYTLSFYGSGSVDITGGHTATVAGVGDFPNRKAYAFTPSAGSSTFTVTGDVKFAQLEAGAFATSFIPTAAASVLRNADVVSMTGTNFSDWFTSSLSIVANGKIFATSAATHSVLYSVSNAANTEYIDCRLKDRFLAGSRIAGSGGTVIQFSQAAALNTSYGIGFANNNTVKAAGSFAGNTVVISAGAGTLANSAKMNIGRRFDGATDYLNGWVEQIFAYPQALTDAETQAFSK